MLLDENYWTIPPDLETYALEHPMIPLGEAARAADTLAALEGAAKPLVRSRRLPPWPQKKVQRRTTKC